MNAVWVDLNNDGAVGNSENLPVKDGKVSIPSDAEIGKTSAKVTFADGTAITFCVAIIENITTPRTVTAVAGSNGSVEIEGSKTLTVTNTEPVKITAIPDTGYNFGNWTDAKGNVVSNDNPLSITARRVPHSLPTSYRTSGVSLKVQQASMAILPLMHSLYTI